MVNRNGNVLEASDRHGALRVVLDGTPQEAAVYAAMVEAVKGAPATATVAVVGGGLCRLQSALAAKWPRLDIYELHPEIQAMNADNPEGGAWRWIIGDYKDTLPAEGKRYDVLIFDVDEDPVISLDPYLAPGGLLLTWNEMSAGVPK